MVRSEVVAVTSMRDYFRAAVDSALAHQTLRPDVATSAYLVDLLCEFARSQHKVLQNDVLARPMTWVVATAGSMPDGRTFEQLREVGDRSLYVAGYFQDSLPHQQLDLDYFVEVGGTAYRQLSDMLGRPGASTRFVVVYRQLGNDFVRYVDVLNDVRRLGE